MNKLEWFDDAAVRTAITPERARMSIARALVEGFDPADDPCRIAQDAGAGHLLLMPSTIGAWTGVKVASVSPDNPAQGLPRIQGTYLLMDSATLTPRAVVEAASLTLLRTPAVSAVAADTLTSADADRLVVFGSGPQGKAHAVALAAIRPFHEVVMIGRNTDSVTAAVAELTEHGLPVRAGSTADIPGADVIACCTTASEPVFDGSLVADGACVIAMGSHEPDKAELDADLMGRSLVVVEDVLTARREAGDVIQAIDAGTLDPADLVGMAAVVRGEVPRVTDRPNVFKGTGMSWQDLAVARSLMD